MKVELLQTGGYNFNLLEEQVNAFLWNTIPEGTTSLVNTQFSITSKEADNNFFEGAGNTSDKPEDFCKLNPVFENTVIEQLFQDFPDYYRWRILIVKPKQTYSVHHDSSKPGFKNLRLHIPVATNPDAFLMFYENKPTGNGAQRVEHHNLKQGEIYEVNTSGYHTAVNYHPIQNRIHIVAERFVPHE